MISAYQLLCLPWRWTRCRACRSPLLYVDVGAQFGTPVCATCIGIINDEIETEETNDDV